MTITDDVTDTKDSSSFSPYNTKVTVVIQPHHQYHHHAFRLRIIQINDVYELDQLPKFKSLLNEYTTTKRSDTTTNSHNDTNENADHTIVICCGDFVAPSLLSSLDEGYSMIDLLNLCGIDYVCLGNHETDISISALHDRIVHQSQFTWINSNIIPSSFSSSSSFGVTNDHRHSSNTKKMTLPWKHLPEYCEIVLHLLDTTDDDGNAVVDDDNVVNNIEEKINK